MARRRSFLQGSVLLSLVVLHSLVAPPGFAQGSRKLGAIAAAPAGGICETSVIVHGYKCHEFEVTTEDGYILSLQRIPEGRSGGGGGVTLGGKKPPVIIQHGVLVDGMTWLLNPAEQDLPLILAENGFDVWIANARGTSFSRKHVTLDTASREFWNWSWDEIVNYDLPAIFDFVFSQTHQKIDYVGHSLGTLIMLAALSEGKLVEKVRSAALLSPVAYLSHMTTALGVLTAKSFVGEITTLLGIAEFNPKGKAVTDFLNNLCKNHGINCYDLLTAITGKNCCLNSSTVDLFLKYEPQSTSTKNMVHLAQTVKYRTLAKYNYENLLINLLHYGGALPPAYNLADIPRDFPLFLSYGGEDSLADPRDVEYLLDVIKLHDVEKLHVQFVEDYAHADFIMGVNAKDVVYHSVVSFFKGQ